MHKRKQYMKTALCLLLSAGLVCSDMPFTAFAAENNPQTESVAAIQETAQTQETQSEYSAENHADMGHVKTDSMETAATECTVEGTTLVETAGTQTKETETAEAQTTDVNKSEAVEEEQTQETQTKETETAETEEPPSKGEFSTETDTEEQTETAASETTTEAESASDKETETIENAETETETMTEMESVTEETETITEIETESVTEEVKIKETENRLTFSDTDIAHGEYKENGSDITWVIDKDGKLTVEGTGDVSDGSSDSRSPWHEYRNDILSAEIKVTGMTHASNMFYGCSHLKEINLSGLDTRKMRSVSGMFSGCGDLTGLDLSGFDTSNVIIMDRMFSDCSSLTNLDLSSFNTSNVTSMYGMFSGCSSLTDLDISNFNTGNMTDMSSMFSGCSSLTNLDLSSLNTSNVTSMSGMFSDCSSLTNLDLSSLNTSNAKNISRMFSGCSSLTDLDISNFNTGNVTDMSSMFYGCSSLKKLDLSVFNTSNVANMSGMFGGCSGLSGLDISNFDTSNVANMSSMFYDCSSLSNLELNNFDTSSVVNMRGMFSDCSGLSGLDISNFDTSNVTNMERMFDNCSGLESLNLSGFDMNKVLPTGYIYFFLEGCTKLSEINTPRNVQPELSLPDSNAGWYDGIGELYKNLPQKLAYSILLTKGKAPAASEGYIAVSKKKTLYYLGDTIKDDDLTVVYHASDGTVTTLNVGDYTTNASEIDISKEGMKSLTVSYNGLTAEIKLRISKAPGGTYTENGNNIVWMLDSDGNLTVEGTGDFAPKGNKEDRAPWYRYRASIKSVKAAIKGMTDAGYMFNGCTSLESVDLNGLDTGNVTDMGEMFQNCSSLTSVDLSSFDTSNVTRIDAMFNGCSELTKLNISGFNTSKVTDMGRMFSYCSSLTDLDLSSFDTESVYSMWSMFEHCYSLEKLNISGFNTSKVNDMRGMFGYCKSLTCLDLGGFDTHNVTSMDGLFVGCESLTELNISSFNTEKVESMSSMFEGCERLKEIDLSRFDTHNVGTVKIRGSMGSMFTRCSSLESLDLSSFDTRNVKDMSVMFRGCTNLKTLNLGSFNTVEVENMSSMFSGCSSLTSLDLSGFDMGRVAAVEGYFGNMLQGCDMLSVVYTARNLNLSVPLPSGEWQDMAGTVYTNLPTGISYSILLAKDKKPETAAERITASKENTVYHTGDTINTDDLTVRYYGADGTVKVLESGYTTNVSKIDMSTAGSKTLVVTYQSMTAQIQLMVLEKEETDKKVVTISGIEIKDSVYNKTPATYTGKAKAVSETDNADVTGSVTLTYTYSGTQADGSAYAVSTTAPTNAGSYKLTVAVTSDNADYTGSMEYPFTIAKAPLIITARDMGLKIGADLPKAEDYQYDTAGLLEGDTLITNPTLSCGIADTTKTGTYDITISGADAGMSYEITYQNGTLTVSETGESAKYYTVIFNLSGKGSDITNTGVKEGSLLEQPQEPQAEGYIFAGWYKDQACTVRWDFGTDTVQADTTLYAGWKKKDADNEEDASWHISEIAPVVYTGNAIKPAVTVYDSDGTLLKKGTHYTIAYKNNTDADKVAAAGGTRSTESGSTDGFHEALPHIIITGKGNYTGSVYKNFHIYPASISIDGETPAKGFTLKCTEQFVTANKEQKPFASIKYKKAMTIGKDYDIAFSKYAADGSLQEITSGSTVPAISANDAGTFRLVITGKGNFSGTIEKDIYVGSKDSLMKNAKITVGKGIKNVQYTGADIEPKASVENGADVFTVKLGNKFLTPEADYTVSYRNNRAVGTATIIIKGKGQYIGTKSVVFKIKGTPFKVKDAAVKNFEASRVYTGSAIEQGRDGVTIGEKTLNYGTDYTTAYRNNVKKGTATVTFVANPESGYSGSFNKTFKITAADLSAVASEFSDYTITGTGTERRLDKNVPYSKEGAKTAGSLRLTDVNGRTLQNGIDYTISYAGNKKADAEAAMSIKGKGNYTGKITVKYTVGKASLEGNERLAQSCTPVAFSTSKTDSYLYKPKFKLMDGKKALSAKTDYKQLTNESYINCTQDKIKAYLDALEGGTVTGTALADMRPCVIIEAADNGNYAGSTKVYLTIYRTKLTKNALDVQITGGDIYTGKQVTPTVTVKLNTDGKILVEGRDYTLSYGANTAAGRNKGSITVSGTGLYGGSVTIKFTIQSQDINKK